MIEIFLINSAFIFGIRALVSPGMIGFFLVKKYYAHSFADGPFVFEGPMTAEQAEENPFLNYQLFHYPLM